MTFLQELIAGFLLPVALSGAVCLPAAWAGRRREGLHLAWAGALAVGLGYVAGHSFLVGRAVLRPLDVQDWLPYLAAGAVVIGAVETVVPLAMRWVLRVAMVGATVGLILRPMAQNAWDTPTTAVWLAATGVGMLVLWGFLARLADREPGMVAPWAFGLVAAGLAPTLVLAHSLVLGRLAGVFALTLAPLAFAAARAPRAALGRGFVPVAVVLLVGLILVGHFYADLSAPCALLLAFAPLGAWVVRLGPIRRRARWVAILSCTLAVLVPVGAAVAIAARGAAGEEAPSQE